jgi:transposase
MPGFVVGARLEVDGEWWLHVETTDDVVGCDACGTRAVGHGRRHVKVRDLPVAGRPVVLVWAKRLWRCPDPGREVVTWSEDVDGIAPRTALTERAREDVCRRVGRDAQSVARVARDFGVSWHTAMAAVRDHGRPRVDHLSRLDAPSALGLDETTFLAANAKHPTLLVTGFVDLDRHRLVDMVENRSAQAVFAWLRSKPEQWRDGIVTVAIDPYRGYARAVAEALGGRAGRRPLPRRSARQHRARRGAPTRAAGDPRPGRKDDPLYRIRRLLLVAHERLTERGMLRVRAGLDAGDPEGEVGAAYLAKELLREVYGTTSLREARRRLRRFRRHCAQADVAELARLSRTVRSWEQEILGWHRTGLSNGPTEATNLLIKKVKRVGHGFRNFGNYRLRVLLHCGVQWQTRPVAAIRGRQPSLVA